MEGYSAKVRESSRELSVREKIAFKDTTNCISLDTATQGQPVIIDFDLYVVLDIHNEKSEDKDYTKYVIVDKNGDRYTTGSQSFWSAFTSIVEEMLDAGETDFKVKAYRMPSKNFVGRDFITCSLA